MMLFRYWTGRWRQTEPALILCAVRWYLRYSLSLWDVEELLEERSVLLLTPALDFVVDQNHVQIPSLSFYGGTALLILLALELADRVTMKRDLEIAREIQGWLMPAAAPQLPGVDIAFVTRPANTVAGDYYDAFLLPQSSQADGPRLLVAVADIAGKSVPAALLMATLQASLRTLAALPGNLSELMERLNRYACSQNLGGRRFTTQTEFRRPTGR
jgi:hypothetical protein